MAKIKMSVGKEAAAEAATRGDFETAPPGLYVARVKEINQGFSKGTNGQPDKKKPRVEMVLVLTGVGRENTKLPKAYGQVWDYISMSAESEWKRAEWMVALGKKIKGNGFELEDEESKPGTDIGRSVLVRLKADTNQNGDPTVKVQRILPFVQEDDEDEDEEYESDTEDDDDADDDESEEESDDEDESDDDDDEESDDESDEDDEDEDDDEDDDEDEGYTAESLKALKESELKKIAKIEFDLNTKKLDTKAKLVKAILKKQETPFN